MIKTSTIKKTLFTALVLTAPYAYQANAQAITEEFDDITTLAAAGWEMYNVSNPVGTTAHFQGNDAVFAAFSGAGTSYIGANYNNTSGSGTISNWLLSPTVTFNNGDSITFYTRKTDSAATVYPDRLQLNISFAGSSNDIGMDEFSVGDFSTLAIDINPTYSPQGHPVGYPYDWVQFTYVISGLGAPTSGRFALRYFVENGGPAGANSDYIGIDLVKYIPATVGISESNASNTVSIYPNPATDFIQVNMANVLDESYTVKVFNSIGQEVKSLQLNRGENKVSVDVRNLNAGLYQVLVTNGSNTYRKEVVKK